ncbi:hypothetical protein VAS14_03668 [Photobacterium angustum S14]|uniref:Uncharacterized protein n=1 Tax=Photobacterium angustum (strain S14 / CCUG 15956) TaxID=314292 RepID=Q1ZT44_PHOAS|nr:hypothetical protein VAS14_03668 [Photobacterium angustum S14]
MLDTQSIRNIAIVAHVAHQQELFK